MTRTLRGSAAIAGVATFGCGEAPGFTDIELLARAARAAVADAGLTMRDIDGLCTGPTLSSERALWPVISLNSWKRSTCWNTPLRARSSC